MEEESRKRAAPAVEFDLTPLSRLGILSTLVVGGIVGNERLKGGDLLDAVLAGGGAWLIATVLFLVGLKMLRNLIQGASEGEK